jgi:hypothetical protein
MSSILAVSFLGTIINEQCYQFVRFLTLLLVLFVIHQT